MSVFYFISPHILHALLSQSSLRREAVNSNFWNVYTVQTYFLHEFMLVIIIFCFPILKPAIKVSTERETFFIYLILVFAFLTSFRFCMTDKRPWESSYIVDEVDTSNNNWERLKEFVLGNKRKIYMVNVGLVSVSVAWGVNFLAIFIMTD